MRKSKNWKYKNTILLILTLYAVVYFHDAPIVTSAIEKIGSLGYFGIFLTGMLFTSVFTVAPASVALYALAQNHNPFAVAILGGLGASVGDYLIFRFLKDKIFEELTPVFKRMGGKKLSHLIHTRYFSWLIPLIGVIIIASPLPDEVGLGLMGLTKIKTWQFFLITFILNGFGILLLAFVAHT
jgi:membrane protein YqaA with SNARE-associated domain